MAEVKSVMMDSLSASQVKQQAQTKVQKSSDSFGNYLNTSQTSASKNNVSKSQTNNVKVTNQSKVQNTSDKVSDLNSGKTSNDVNQKTVDKVSEKITNDIKDTLGIDDETLANAMTALGLSTLDLLDSNNLAKLVLYVNGSSDFTDLLTDENMMNQLSALNDAMDNINWEDLTGMSKSDFIEGAALLASTSSDVKSFEDSITGISVEDDSKIAANVSENGQIPVTDTKDVSVENESLQPANDNVSDNVSEARPEVSVVKEEDNSTQQDSSQTEESMSGAIDEQILRSDDDSAGKEPVPVQNDFLQNLNQAVNDVSQTAKPESVRMQQMVDIVNQVVEKIKVSLGTDSTSMEMQLNPEHLGKVLLNVSSKNGMMTAVFSVQSEEARAALESQMFTLRENLELRELKVDAVEVNVSDFDFSHSDQAMSDEQSKADNGNGKQMKFEFGDDSSDATVSNEEKEAVRRQVMRDNGSQIDFTA